jgi:transposase
MRRVELYERIREDHRQGASIRSLVEQYGVHRRTVREAVASAVPSERAAPVRERPALTDELRAVIDQILRVDKDAPRKQRHTARRIFQRLVEERGAQVSESSVRAYVHDRRRELGVGTQVFVPQHHPWGKQGEVDFYEAEILFPSGPATAHIVALRSEASAAAMHSAYPNETQAAFFEGIARGLEFVGGVFPILRFDNLSAAVARVLRGRRREEQDRFVAFRELPWFRWRLLNLVLASILG